MIMNAYTSRRGYRPGSVFAVSFTCAITLCWAAAASANSSPASAPTADAAQPGEADTSSGLAEIVVTAQRREEKSQDVPIAVNAIDGALAANMAITGDQSLVSVVPSLVFAKQAGGAKPYLRGVGSTSGDINAENSVAIYVDGVYQPTGASNIFEFNNIERVEVLKGPQGTLFGRNATGGVIQVITRDPSFTPSGEVSVGFANYRTFSGEFYGTTGLSDTVAVNIAARGSNESAGWGHNLLTGAPTFQNVDKSARGKLLFAPSDATHIVLAAEYFRFQNEGIGAQVPFGLSGSPARLNLGLPASPANAFSGSPYTFPGPFNTYSNYPDQNNGESNGLSLKINHDFGPMELHSISAYKNFHGFWSVDQDLSSAPGVAAGFQQKAMTISQELHLLAPADAKFQWLTGLFYYRNSAQLPLENLALGELLGPGRGGPVFGPFGNVAIKTKTVATSIAAFAQGTYPLAEATNLTAGLRVTYDKAHFNGSMDGTLFPDLGGITLPLVPYNTADQSYTKPTWRLALDHHFARDVLGYVSYNRGIKSGNFSASVALASQGLYLPEQLDAYEVGVKSEELARRLRVNADVYYYSYKNAQFQKIVEGASETLNADTAKLYGAELETQFQVTNSLTLMANAAYQHSRFGNFPFVATYRLPGGTSLNTTPGQYNAQGNQAPNAPKLSGNVGFDYKVPSDIGLFDLTGNLYITDRYFTEPDNRLYVAGHVLVNAGVSWSDNRDKWLLRLWGKNLSNVYYYAQLTGQDGASDLGGPAPPRQYGVTLGYKF